MKHNEWVAAQVKTAGRLPVLEIEGPPCKQCEHWRPEIVWRKGEHGQVPANVKLCHAEMFNDFSCFGAKKETA